MKIFAYLITLLGVLSESGKAAVIPYGFDFDLGSSCISHHGCEGMGTGVTELRRELFPVVPQRMVRVMLPQGETIDSYSVAISGLQEVEYTPEMVGRNRPFSMSRDFRGDIPKYQGGVYPRVFYEKPVIREFRGMRIAELVFYPLRVTSPGKAEYYDHADVTITTKAALMGLSDTVQPRGLARDLIMASIDTINRPGYVDDSGDAAVGYLIIGPQALIGTKTNSVLKPLIDEKTARGINVILAPLETVSAGKDPKQIRDFIRTQHSSAAVDYVLLVGDHKNLPWKKIVSGLGSDNGDPIPSDHYYACLDGDFTTVASYDWSCEVAVGRVAATQVSELQAWVAKNQALHELTKNQGVKSALSFGEELDDTTLGGWVLDRLIGDYRTRIETTGFPQSMLIKKLYDTSSVTVSASQFVKTLNDGKQPIVNHLGHANATYDLRLDASSIPTLPSHPYFIYSEGCYPNDPDTKNWTQQAVNYNGRGPAAMISNTRYGWYEQGRNGEGSSALLHRIFWSTNFKNGVKPIGQMNVKAKELAIGVDRSSLMIYTALESNLIGDPELDFHFEE